MMKMRRGFTLIELMIVVAILGIVAAIAVGQFVGFEYKAKRSEVMVNANKAFQTLGVYVEAQGGLGSGTLSTGMNPTPAPSSISVNGKIGRFWDTSNTDWKELDWSPTGKVWCSYEAYADGSPSPAIFYITGICDIDNDGIPYYYYVYGPHYTPGSERTIVESNGNVY